MLKNKSIFLELPWPPSVNHYWRHTKTGHYISQEGKIYRETVYYACVKYKQQFDESDRLSVKIDAFPPDRRKRDLDNLLKSILDSLQKAEVYQDDSQIDMLSIKRNSPLEGRIAVAIEVLP